MKKLFTPLFLFFVTYLSAQDFYDLNTIQTIEITFAQSNWDALLDAEKAGNGNYTMAQSVVINGENFDSVGVKYKGNSTYNRNQIKNPFHIELDTYKNQDYQGYKDIKLSNVAKDPSFLREILSYQVIRQYMDASLSNYANVYVNGNLIGLYSNSEAVNKTFINDRFGSKNNTFIKCNPPAGAGPQTREFPNLAYLGQDSTDYYSAYELKSDAGWQALINFCDTLENHQESIATILDVDRTLWMLALNNVLVNLDSYIGGFKQNYYLYKDDNQRFLPIMWDFNESIGQFSLTGDNTNLNNTTAKQRMNHLLHENDSNFPLVQQLLSNPMYKRMYLAHYKTILLENFDNGAYFTVAQTLHNLVEESVRADPNKLFTYNNFITNLTADVSSGGGGGGRGNTPGIQSLLDGRADYLLGLSDFTATAPTITAINLSNTIPTVGGTTTLTATISEENAVFIGYRSSERGPFTRVEMLDDGAHNDGAANDGTYGVTVPINSISTQYYIYAENNNAGIFSPLRAEHEFHTITATLSEVVLTDLVINEFMASNDSTIADQDGEYEDWIELYNGGETALDLTGYFLSDDANNLTQWPFPAGTIIAANGYLTIWADGDEDQTGLHANFKLSASAESILLVNANLAIIDEVVYTDQKTDISFARIPNGTGDFQATTATFGATNGVGVTDCSSKGGDADNDGICADNDCDDNDANVGAKQTAGTSCDDGNAATTNDVIQAGGCFCAGTISTDLVINEFMANNDSTIADQDGEYEDWIELYNGGETVLDLTGYFLSDNGENLSQWAFPAGTIIAANGYLTIWADGDEDQAGLHANFKLSAASESIFLANIDTAIIDVIAYTDQTTDISFARIPNGTGDFQARTATFGTNNDGNTTSTNSIEIAPFTLKAFPNPATESFYLEIIEPQSQLRTISIYNLNGTVIFQQEVYGNKEIDTSDWAAGLYIVRTGAAFLKVMVL